MLTRARVMLTVLAGSLVWRSATVLACPMCAEALRSAGPPSALARASHAFLVSMIALLGVPATLLVGLALPVVRSVRRGHPSSPPS